MPEPDTLQHLLEAELHRLQRQLGLAQSLTVCSRPDPSSPLSGEVKRTTIYIYNRNPIAAVNTLRHEVVDYCISHASTPYRNVVNHLIKSINHDAYQRKEAMVEALLRLLHTHARVGFTSRF